ncbi:Sjogren's syndrome/scleroderma autoantigen 1 family protein [Halorussus aquaticus]|uniref:Sjogren's syndrome/scleroderma autoantigen 1 family protein n=1 Tax=Halorussus aquaticus TaxID=2953748 RepID=A0ABD5Q798_9EURY|nr:Sjogren's syndrome/scleroderma autoantigen 1 family protein [Halorussus aquaticus]
MSSDDSEFDKEAEREKLREKYGDEGQDRENTRRMSELLLQGATMTGKHCDNCGDPIFRYDGQEFCPTCQHEARAQAESQNGDPSEQSQQPAETPAQAEANADRDQSTAETADRSTADESDDADDEPYVEINDVRVADQHADRSDLRRPPSQTDADRRDGQSRDAPTENPVSQRRADERRSARDRSSANASGHRHAHGATSAHRDDLGTAREALVRKLSSLAHEAETTDDVARARDLLAATREAAEALAALDRANR